MTEHLGRQLIWHVGRLAGFVTMTVRYPEEELLVIMLSNVVGGSIFGLDTVRDSVEIRQRLGIAQAQINHPDLLILDEPAAALDPMGRHDVLEVMERLQKHTTIFYSTHILDDVQRVSDDVAILDHGELVAQAPIEELLTGSSGTVYWFVLRGDATQAQARIAGQPWVSNINVLSVDGEMSWQVTVTDEAAAEDQLLRLVLSDEGVNVTHFGRKTYELEEVFLNTVEGSRLEPVEGGDHG